MIVNTSVPRDRLTTAINYGGATHLRSILIAVRDAGVALCIVPQGGEAFAPPTNKPTVVIIGDDMVKSLGPTAFHQKSLRRFVKTCRSAVIVACEPISTGYAAAAATAAILRQNSIIVETRPENEANWKAALDGIKPSLNYIICTVKPEGGVH